jgi:tetratricopeptide (TPR) repeat protein
MSQHIIRAQLFLEHARFQEAEQELRQAATLEPGNAFARSLLAITLSAQDRHQDALYEAQKALSQAPALPYSHFALAVVLRGMAHYDQARSVIEEAIRLDPADPRHHEVLASIHLQENAWQAALDAADRGLALDSENVRLLNLRAMALVKLSRKDEAAQTMGFALARDPENATTHANQGWALLHRGEYKQAMVHFGEALRLNPESVWAKQGIVEALRARSPIYRVMLRYFLWMSRLSARARWGVIIGLYLLSRLARTLALADPGLAPVLTPLLILYAAFAFLTWIAGPLFDLFLRLHPFGRLALSGTRTVASNWVGGCLFVALAVLVAGLASGNGVLIRGALVPMAMVLPVSAVFHTRAGRRRRTLALVTATLGAVGVGGVLSSLLGVAASSTLDTLFWFGWIGYSWLANAIA